MRASERRWLDGSIDEPTERYRCFIFDALAAIAAFAPEAAAGEAGLAGFGAEALGGAEAAGLGAEAAGVGAGLASTAADVLGATTPLTTGGLDAALAAPLTVEPAAAAATTALPAATSVGGPVAAAEAVPLSVGAASPTATGVGLGGDVAGGAGLEGAGAAGFGTGTPGGGAVTGGSTGGGITGGLDRALSSATGGAVNMRDLGTIGSIGGLGMNFLNRNQPIPGEKQLKQAAGSLTATAAAEGNQARVLENYLQSGTLPPGIEQGLRSASSAAMATVRAQHASRGTSGSSAEAQDLQNVQDRAVAAGQDIALKLLQQGTTIMGMATNTEGMAAQLYSEIMREALAQDQQLGASIANFASAMAGGNRGTSGTTTATV